MKRISRFPVRKSAISAVCIALVGATAWLATGVSSASAASEVEAVGASCRIALFAHAGTGRIDQEIRHFQDKVRTARDQVPYLDRLGWSFVAKARASFDPGYYTLAEQSALCIESLLPTSLEAELLKGHVLLHQHRFAAAEQLAVQLVAKRGQWFDHALLGDALMEQGKLDEAVTAYQSMMDQRPGPQAYGRAAHMRWLTGDLAGAIAMMRLAAGSFHDPEASAWSQTRIALYEMQAGRIEAASQALASARAVLPDYPPALLAEGRILLAQEKWLEALAPLRRAATGNPLPEYQWALLEALQAAGLDAESAKLAAEFDRQGATLDRRTYALYLATISRDSALAVRLAEVELTDRADAHSLDAMAWALRNAGRLEEALQWSKRAVASGVDDARLSFHVGVIATDAGQYELAATWLAKATATRQMLLPSEREHLARASASLAKQTSSLSRP